MRLDGGVDASVSGVLGDELSIEDSFNWNGLITNSYSFFL